MPSWDSRQLIPTLRPTSAATQDASTRAIWLALQEESDPKQVHREQMYSRATRKIFRCQGQGRSSCRPGTGL